MGGLLGVTTALWRWSQQRTANTGRRNNTEARMFTFLLLQYNWSCVLERAPPKENRIFVFGRFWGITREGKIPFCSKSFREYVFSSFGTTLPTPEKRLPLWVLTRLMYIICARYRIIWYDMVYHSYYSTVVIGLGDGRSNHSNNGRNKWRPSREPMSPPRQARTRCRRQKGYYTIWHRMWKNYV